MSWGDTLICVISRGVQLFYGIAQCSLAADDVDVAYGWRMVKSVVASCLSVRSQGLAAIWPLLISMIRRPCGKSAVISMPGGVFTRSVRSRRHVCSS